MRVLLAPALTLFLVACGAGQLGDPCMEDADCAGDLWCHLPHEEDEHDEGAEEDAHDEEAEGHAEGFCDDEHGRH